MTPSLEGLVTAALSQIQNPRLQNDLLSAGMIRDLVVTADGAVSFSFVLSREDPATGNAPASSLPIWTSTDA